MKAAPWADPEGVHRRRFQGLPAPALAWAWSRFEDLSLDDLYDALALRCRAFIVDQGPYQDPDGLDRHAWHLLGRDREGVLVAYLRMVDPGCKYAEPSMGRVVIAPEVRGRGLGRVLVAEGLRRAHVVWPERGNRISAQAHLSALYQGFGYRVASDPYLEDGIPHIEMVCPAPADPRPTDGRP